MEQVSINPEMTGAMAPGQEMPTEDVAQQQAGETQQERPSWLPEGFESPEDLAKAYAELRAGKQTESEDTPMTPEDVASDEKLSKFSSEFFEKGSLSPDSYKELSKMGYPRTVVDQFIEGQQARMSLEEQKVYAEIGGKDAYTAMTEWAGKNMQQKEIEAFNRSVESGDLDQAMFAVKGLQARFKAASGAAEPKFVQSSGKSTPGAFNSVAQVVEAMSDRRYKTDPAYRSEVERKIGNSTVL